MIASTLKRYFVVSALVVAAVASALACGPMSRPHYYVFSAYQRNQATGVYANRVNDFWHQYAPVTVSEPWHISTLSSVENEVFEKSDNAIVKTALKKRDTEMVDYLRLLTKYLNISDQTGESWEYPDKEELAQRNRDLKYINNRARSYGGSRLAGQYCLLVMRTMMLMGDNQGNIQYWNAHKDKLRPSVYRDMMKGIYAGALLNTGKKAEAADIYYELGDMASLRWIMRDNISLDGLKKEYKRDPNSPALIYLVQELTNVLSDSRYSMVRYNLDGLAENARDIRAFNTMAQRVLKEGKTQCPALWQSAMGWLNHSLGNNKEALTQLEKAMKMQGTERMLDNARVCRLLTTAEMRQPDKGTCEFLKQEMQWMVERESVEEADAYCTDCKQNHYTEVLQNLVYDTMAPAYMEKGGNTKRLGISLIEWMDNHTNTDSDFKTAIDNLTADDMMEYNAYTESPTLNSFEKWLRQDCKAMSEDQLNDLIGTKFIREGQFAEATEFLKRVSLNYLSTQAIAPYVAARTYKKEPCFNRQLDYKRDGKIRFKSNQKLDFARDMVRLLKEYQTEESGLARANVAYTIANYYHQASYKGNCWYLSRYGNSVYDTVCYEREKDFVAEAAAWYRRAIDEPGIKIGEKQTYIYAAAYLPFGEPFITYEYDSNFDLQPVFHYDTYQGRMLAELNDAFNYNLDLAKPFVIRCDILRRYRASL